MSGKGDRASRAAMTDLHLPVPLRVLGDEVRALKDYVSRGLVTQDEAEARLLSWNITYPPGYAAVIELAYSRGRE